MRTAIAVLLLAIPSAAFADDELSASWLGSRPAAGISGGLQNTLALRWDHEVSTRFELGVGVELGHSDGVDSLDRVALLPGIAVAVDTRGLDLRFEEQLGWQLVHGHVTVDELPFGGTETRSFHDELAIGLGTSAHHQVDVRARAGLAIDGVFPKGHSSLRVAPFVGIVVVHEM